MVKGTSIQRVCPACGTGFCRRGRIYCSKTCATASQRKPVASCCRHCGKAFVTTPGESSRGGGKYCSTSCYHASPRDKGAAIGSVTLKGGYRVVRLPNHPRADRRGRVKEHILVLEKKLGRPLEPGEVGHHINGNRADNRPENLEAIASQSEHFSLHMKKFHQDHPNFRYLTAEQKRALKNT